MMNQLSNATVKTPVHGCQWRQLSSRERLIQIQKALGEVTQPGDIVIEIVEAKDDGQIIMRLPTPLAPGERGTLLLDIEEHLKNTVDEALVLWLEPLGDRSSLRKLRGIEVK